MKTIIQIAFMTVFGLTACQNAPSVNARLNAEAKDKASKEDKSTAKGGSTLNGIVSSYLKIKNALANDNAEEAAKAGIEFRNSISQVNKSAMTANQQETLDAAGLNARELTEDFQQAGDKIGYQRSHFDLLSQNLYNLLKAIKPGMTLYNDFCPMYDNNKGATWISETKDIKNPYLGTKMLTCGEIKEEIQ